LWREPACWGGNIAAVWWPQQCSGNIAARVERVAVQGLHMVRRQEQQDFQGFLEVSE
jgi:hypothetical protein